MPRGRARRRTVDVSYHPCRHVEFATFPAIADRPYLDHGRYYGAAAFFSDDGLDCVAWIAIAERILPDAADALRDRAVGLVQRCQQTRSLLLSYRACRSVSHATRQRQLHVADDVTHRRAFRCRYQQ